MVSFRYHRLCCGVVARGSLELYIQQWFACCKTMGSRKELISALEIEKHNSPDSLWIIVEGKVYDMTRFAPLHPGGVDSTLRGLAIWTGLLIRYCSPPHVRRARCH